MKNVLVTLIVFLAIPVHGQSYCTAEIGIGVPTFWSLGLYHEHHSTFVSPVFELSYLKMIQPRVYCGAKLLFERYSFSYTSDPHYHNDEVIHKSNFLLLAPTIDVSIGKLQNGHVYFFVAPGVLVYGSQSTSLSNNSTVISNSNTSNEISKFIVRIGMGLEQHPPIEISNYDIIFSESYSFMAGDLTQLDYDASYNASQSKALHPGYFSLKIGVRHKLKDKQKVNPVQQTP
jgi:hypothetical protein